VVLYVLRPSLWRDEISGETLARTSLDDFSAQMSPLLSFLVLTSSPLISFFRFNDDDDIFNMNNRLKKNNARISTTKRT